MQTMPRNIIPSHRMEANLLAPIRFDRCTTIIKLSLITLCLTFIHQHTSNQVVQALAPQTAALPWMTQVAALSGQTPKLSKAPLVQLDTGSKYYKTVIDGMMHNFRSAVHKASKKSFSLNNATSSSITLPINLGGGDLAQRVSIQDFRIDGLADPKVSNVYVNKKNMKLHVIFTYKTIKAYGRCQVAGSLPKSSASSGATAKPLLEAVYWNTSWSASVMQMIGREHFDMSRVYASHSQQKLTTHLNPECPPAAQEKVKSALVDRIRSSIEQRLVEIMETVIMQTDSSNEDFLGTSTSAPVAAIAKRSKRAAVSGSKNLQASSRKTKVASRSTKKKTEIPVQRGGKDKAPKQNVKSSPKWKRHPGAKNDSMPIRSARVGARAVSRESQRPLKRTKRQTPCQQGEELDDYVDQLFRFGTRIVRAMEPITLPNATIELPDYNLKIFLYEGKGTRAYKFRRTKSAWVFCSNETISLGLTIEVEELRVAYKYRVISGTRLVFDGDLEAKVSPKVQAQFSQAVQEEDSEEPVQQRVDRIRVFRLGKVHVVIRGLGNLTQSLSMLINSYLNDNQEELQPTFRMVEGDAVKFINKMLANVNVPLLSVV